jgi:(E)-4-hydroxy-3-methylbut-2-enyl-diphosphate synthase
VPAHGQKTQDPQQFEDERAYIEETFTPLVERCKELGRAIRIGTNHGSLSARIMSFYGDSAQGMVESALEFANICRKLDFHNFVFSMKASNPVVMVQAYRLLAATQYELGWDYPLHLGVTEAGEGEDGRMKSAIGIGALLADGLGDTIRVSLTEDPEFELEPCRTLAQLGDEAVSDENRQKAQNVIEFDDSETRPITSFTRREVTLDESIYTDEFQALHRDGSVLTAVSASDLEDEQGLYVKLGMKTAVGMPFKDVASSDSIVLSEVPSDKTQLRTLQRLQTAGVGIVVPASVLRETPLEGAIALVDGGEATPECARAAALRLTGAETDAELAAASERKDVAFAVVDIDVANLSRTHAARRVFHHLKANDCAYPAILRLGYDANSARAPNNGPLRKDLFILRMGMDGGSLSVDGLVDGFFVDAPFDVEFLRTASFGLLQGSRMRNVKTEFVSCPSCGRTLFDLQEVTAQISERTGHLPGVTIAIMGCIVNGPGEMADADFGYVGGAPGMVDLYVGKTVVRGGIPNEDACDALVELIKENDRWVEPSEVEEEELVEA